jgi:hypothetical protein
MQMQVDEYHGLLMLLGLPEWWRDASRFTNLLSRMDSPPASIELEDARLLGEALASSLPMISDPRRTLASEHERPLGSLARLPLAMGTIIQLRNNWREYSEAAVDMTPPALLTVRNTRSGLARLGYRFPARSFHAPDLSLGEAGQRFLRRIETYLRDSYGRVETAVDPKRGSALGFVRSTYYQRLVSSFSSAAHTLKNRAESLRHFLEAGELPEEPELPDDVPGFAPRDPGATASRRVDDAKRLARIELRDITDMLDDIARNGVPQNDPKLDAMRSVLLERLACGDKVLVFSRFTDTVDACIDAISDTLRERGVGFGRYTGGACWVQAGPVRNQANKAQLCSDLRSGRVRVVFCSDAAAEGLNLQAARCIINVDVPWNPARLEQRIGRIARLGQRAPSVDIYNLWYAGTVESQMYSRLIARQDLYELAVGEFPDVVGEAIRRSLDSSGRVDVARAESVLAEMRSRSEMRALQRIWSAGAGRVSVGGQLRAKLFEVLVGLAQREGIAVKLSGSKATWQAGGIETELDSAPGEPDSIHLYHPAFAFMDGACIAPNRWQLAGRIAVLRDPGGPLAFLCRDEMGYRLLGTKATGDVICALALGGPEPELSLEPLLPVVPTAREIVDALRAAFPGRIEVGEVSPQTECHAERTDELLSEYEIAPL